MRYLDVAQLGQTRRLAGLLSRDLVLQHSDLLTIVTNPVAIVPARENYLHRLVSVFFQARFKAKYTGIDVTGSIGIDSVGDNQSSLIVTEALRKQFFGDSFVGNSFYAVGGGFYSATMSLGIDNPGIWTGGAVFPLFRNVNQPLRLFVNQDDNGLNLTGGHADNELLVRTYYVDERLL